MFCDKNSKYLQALEVGFVLFFIAGVAHAQKGGAKGAMRKGGKGSGGGRGGRGGQRHMEDFEDSKSLLEQIIFLIILLQNNFQSPVFWIIMTTPNLDHVLVCVTSSEYNSFLNECKKYYFRKLRGDKPIKYPEPARKRRSCVGLCHRSYL